jgi:hypothetical protein
MLGYIEKDLLPNEQITDRIRCVGSSTSCRVEPQLGPHSNRSADLSFLSESGWERLPSPDA